MPSNPPGRPRVSVIVPNFNERRESLVQAMDSLRSQTFEDFEVVVVDESTEPELARLCELQCKLDKRFRYDRPAQRIGLAGSLNFGLALSSAEYVARFDSDDVCDPTRLQKQVTFLDAHAEIGVVGSWMKVVNVAENQVSERRYPESHEKIVARFLYSNAMGHPSVMFRRCVVANDAAAYDTAFRYCEDLDLWLRLIGRGVRFANIPECLVTYMQNDVRRPSGNWQLNYEVRRKNLARPNLVAKLVVMNMIRAWALMPAGLQRSIYKRAIFDRQS